ncbi:MAG: hypothetical protein H0U76_14375 [Ktedonobacteraceae bacterium]|nr:hypothetical protein [Ktedonobacteraceae bacterium]
MFRRLFYKDKDIPAYEEIEGLTVSPRTDIPFGKPFQMGLAEYTIYDRAIEQGYEAGIAAHFDYLAHQKITTPVMFDDALFETVLDTFTPKQLEGYNKSLWRAHFLAGWTSVYLGVVRLHEENKS